mgnify:CR=1 FL=1
MSLIHKASLLIQTSNAMIFNEYPTPQERTYKVGFFMTGKSRINSCRSGKVKSVLKCHFRWLLVLIRPKSQNHSNLKPLILFLI